jgi:hypothetical protein
MSKTHKKRQSRGGKTKRRQRQQKYNQRQQQSRKRSGGACGTCGACPMNGGSSTVAPSFSGLADRHFYPQNTFQNDPTHMAAGSRTLPDIPIGMNMVKGGGKKQRQRRGRGRGRRQRGTKKMRGGLNPAGVMASAYSTILGNGLYDNPVVNQGGVGGMVTAAQIMNGNSPQVMPNGPESIKLYNVNNPPLA